MQLIKFPDREILGASPKAKVNMRDCAELVCGRSLFARTACPQGTSTHAWDEAASAPSIAAYRSPQGSPSAGHRCCLSVASYSETRVGSDSMTKRHPGRSYDAVVRRSRWWFDRKSRPPRRDELGPARGKGPNGPRLAALSRISSEWSSRLRDQPTSDPDRAFARSAGGFGNDCPATKVTPPTHPETPEQQQTDNNNAEHSFARS